MKRVPDDVIDKYIEEDLKGRNEEYEDNGNDELDEYLEERRRMSEDIINTRPGEDINTHTEMSTETGISTSIGTGVETGVDTDKDGKLDSGPSLDFYGLICTGKFMDRETMIGLIKSGEPYEYLGDTLKKNNFLFRTEKDFKIFNNLDIYRTNSQVDQIVILKRMIQGADIPKPGCIIFDMQGETDERRRNVDCNIKEFEERVKKYIPKDQNREKFYSMVNFEDSRFTVTLENLVLDSISECMLDYISDSKEPHLKDAHILVKSNKPSFKRENEINLKMFTNIYELNRNFGNEGCFENYVYLQSIYLPDSLKYIGYHTFWGCRNLVQIEIPLGVTELGDSCFYGCSKLSTINIPDGLKVLGKGCFSGCSSLKQIVIPTSVEIIKSSCFYDCRGLSNIDLNANILRLSDGCFSGCVRLGSIRIPEGVRYLGSACFSECLDLSRVILPNSLTSLGMSCFYNCHSLREINLTLYLKEIKSSCFKNCYYLSNTEIPSSVTYIGRDVFRQELDTFH